MNSLSYHESHSHGPLGLPFQAFSQEDPYGQYLCHITGMKKWNFYMSQKEVWCCVPRTVPGCFRKGISILLIPAHCTDCLETVRFPTIMLWFSGWISRAERATRSSSARWISGSGIRASTFGLRRSRTLSACWRCYYQQDVTTDRFEDYDGERWAREHG